MFQNSTFNESACFSMLLWKSVKWAIAIAKIGKWLQEKHVQIMGSLWTITSQEIKSQNMNFSLNHCSLLALPHAVTKHRKFSENYTHI